MRRNRLEYVFDHLGDARRGVPDDIHVDLHLHVPPEMTTLTGRTHRDNLDAYFALLQDAYLRPAFTEADFERQEGPEGPRRKYKVEIEAVPVSGPVVMISLLSGVG